MRRPVPEGYTVSQISLHWIIAALVFYQLWFGEDMARAEHAIRRNQALAPDQATQANLHIWIGFAVLAAVLLRLALRFRFGAPPAPADEPRLVQILGRASHHLFYLFLLLAPVTGIVAYYWIPAFGNLHTLFKPAFIVLIGLHVLAALWHQFVKRDGVLMRMLRPDRRPALAGTFGGAPPAA